jgi:hypothetical protein
MRLGNNLAAQDPDGKHRPQEDEAPAKPLTPRGQNREDPYGLKSANRTKDEQPPTKQELIDQKNEQSGKQKSKTKPSFLNKLKGSANAKDEVKLKEENQVKDVKPFQAESENFIEPSQHTTNEPETTQSVKTTSVAPSAKQKSQLKTPVKVDYEEEIEALKTELQLLEEQLVAETDESAMLDWQKEIDRVTEALEFKKQEKEAYDELIAEGKVTESVDPLNISAFNTTTSPYKELQVKVEGETANQGSSEVNSQASPSGKRKSSSSFNIDAAGSMMERLKNKAKATN